MAAENVGSIVYEVDIDTRGLVEGQKVVDKSLGNVQGDMDKTEKSAAKLGGGLTKLAASFAALASAAAIANQFKQAVDITRVFNAAISELGALTGATGKDLDFLSNAAREFGRDTTLSAVQAAEALKLIASAKPDLLSNAEALKAVTKEAIALAEAAGIDLPQAATALTTTLNQFQLGAEESSRVINVLAAGAKEGSSEIADTVAVLQEAGVVAAQSGVGFEEFNGAVQALAKGAISGSRAGTGLRNVLTILNTQTNDKLKPSIVGLSQALANLEAQGLDDTQMVKLFGRENITAAKVLLQFREESDRVTAAVTGTGEAYRQANERTNNLEGDTKKLGSAYQELQLTIGTLADDTLRSLVQTMTELTLAVASNPEVISNFFKIAGTAAAAFATVMTAKVVVALAASASSALASAAAHITLARQMGVAAVAAKGLRIAMAFLGGPLGVAMLAAVAILAFSDKAETAEERTAELDTAVKELTGSFKEMSATQLNAKLAEFAVEAAELEGQIDRLKNKQVEANKEFASTSGVLGGSATSISQYAKATSDLAEQDTEGLDLTQRLEANRMAAEAARKAIEDIGKVVVAPAATGGVVGDGGGGTDDKAAKEAEKLAQAIRDQVKDLQFQADTLGMTTSELEIYKLQLAGATDEQIRAAQSSLSLVDAYEMQQKAEAELAKKPKADAAMLGQVDPLAGSQQAFDAELERIRLLEEAGILSKQRGDELKLQLEREHLAQMQVLREEDFAKQSATNELLLASLAQLQEGATNALVGLVTGASNGEEAIRSLASSILNEAVGALVKMGIEQVKSIVMGQAAQAAATATGVASAATLATAYAPAAAAASVASFGGAAAAGLSALASAIPAAIGLFAGRAQGGPVQADNMYRINETGGPEIFNAANGRQYMMPNQRGEVVSNKDATSGGNGGGAPIVNVNNYGNDKASASAQFSESDRRWVVDVVVGDIMGDGKTSKAIQRTTGTRRVGA